MSKIKDEQTKLGGQLVVTSTLIILTIFISLLLDADIIPALIYSGILILITDESNQSVMLILLGIILIITNI
ncbi:hypothetical protein [Bacillus alkalicellulosilyticus]|uniref:hypothetical protein n=1 Tax=Alkalihalobacterium alkalicellulosilyticum TaxID=1912214 RepID=UPI000997FD70|nr:hypothetical protein [Bacillus alkalicellulosilyticus]